MFCFQISFPNDSSAKPCVYLKFKLPSVKKIVHQLQIIKLWGTEYNGNSSSHVCLILILSALLLPILFVLSSCILKFLFFFYIEGTQELSIVINKSVYYVLNFQQLV